MIVLNSDWNQWGGYTYNSEHDIFKAEIIPQSIPHTEMFSISFSHVTKTKGLLSIAWEKTKVDLSIETDTFTNTVNEIDKITEKLKGNWFIYSEAAQYYFYELKNASKAMKYIDVAIALNAPNPAPWMLKSQMLASEQKYEEAIRQAELALEVCKIHNFSYEIEENENQIIKWKELIKKVDYLPFSTYLQSCGLDLI